MLLKECEPSLMKTTPDIPITDLDGNLELKMKLGNNTNYKPFFSMSENVL